MTQTDQVSRTREDWKLLRQWVEGHDQSALDRLVRQYIRLVYNVCYRELSNSQMAEDAAQAVLIVLSTRAHTLRQGVVLASWLYGVCRLTCRNLIRQQRREKARIEIVAARQMQITQHTEAGWDEITPFLHDTIDALSSRDRDLILLRYFEELSHREIGDVLRISEESARVGVSRAVDRLRIRLAKAGVAVGAAAFAALLAERSAEAVPEPTVAHVLTASSHVISPTDTGVADHLAQGVIKSMKVMQWKLTAAISLALITTGGVVGMALNKGAGSVHKTVRIAAKPNDPKAAAELQASLAAYSKLSSYTDVEIGVGPSIQRVGIPDRMVMSYRRPGQYAIIVTRNGNTQRTTSDARFTYTESVPPTDHYLRESATRSQGFPPVLFAAGVANGGPSDLLVRAFENADLASRVASTKVSAYFGPPELLDGEMCDVVITTFGSGTAEFAIARTDHLIRRQHTRGPASGQEDEEDATVLYTNVHTNEIIPDSTFAFNPPPGSVSVDSGLQHDANAQAVVQAMYDTYNRMHTFQCTETVTMLPGHMNGTDPDALPNGEIPLGVAVYKIKDGADAIFDIADAEQRKTSRVHIVTYHGTAYASGTGPRWRENMYMKSTVDQNAVTVNFSRNVVTNILRAEDDWMPAMPLKWDMRPADGDYDFSLEPKVIVDNMPMDVIFQPLRLMPVAGQPSSPPGAGERLYIGNDDHLLHRLLELNSDGQGGLAITTHLFTNMLVDKNIPDSNFGFTPPPGAQPVDQLRSMMK